MLPSRWNRLDPHPEQVRLWTSRARFRVVAAGRRSGKTERAKRKLILAALTPPDVVNPRFIAAAPTRDQAKRIFWRDLYELCDRNWLEDISRSDLELRFKTGATIQVVGLDVPERIEGIPIDGAVLDEYAECKPEAWKQSLRPTLSTRGRPPGWCWFTGRPKGRNHFYDLWRDAKTLPDWDAFHWRSSEVLDAREIESAKRDLDPLTYAQEYDADWVTFEGRAYYQWDPNVHLRRLAYDPNLPLVFCFDFNVDPGIAVVVQEQDHKMPQGLVRVTCVVGEVFIPRNSNTPAVCKRLASDWGHHKGPVYVYGDATGGSRKSSQTQGSDWDLVKEYLRPHFDLHWRVERANPRERDRVNAMNARLKSAAGDVRLLIDPTRAPKLVLDFEGVCLLEGGSGEIDKKRSPELSHLSDAIGYYVHSKFPTGGSLARFD